MQYNLKFDSHIEPTPTITDYIDRKIPAIAKFFTKYDPDEVNLIIHFGLAPNKSYEVSMQLTINKDTLRATATANDYFVAIDNAKKILLQEIVRHKEKKQN